MYTTKLHVNELDLRFIEALKTLFKDKVIEIAVCETVEDAEDETGYLLKSPANRDRLLKAIENVKQGRHLVTIDIDELS